MPTMPPPATSAPSASSAMPPPAPRLSQSAPSDLLAGITPKDLKKYAAHYAKLPGGKEGEVSVEHAVRFLCKAKLPADAVRDILARTTGGSTVVRKDAFCAAMHETYGALKSRGGATPAPSQMTATPAAAKPSPSWTPAPPPPPLEPAASGGRPTRDSRILARRAEVSAVARIRVVSRASMPRASTRASEERRRRRRRRRRRTISRVAVGSQISGASAMPPRRRTRPRTPRPNPRPRRRRA